jgi:hypothetical protein
MHGDGLRALDSSRRSADRPLSPQQIKHAQKLIDQGEDQQKTACSWHDRRKAAGKGGSPISANLSRILSGLRTIRSTFSCHIAHLYRLHQRYGGVEFGGLRCNVSDAAPTIRACGFLPCLGEIWRSRPVHGISCHRIARGVIPSRIHAAPRMGQCPFKLVWIGSPPLPSPASAGRRKRSRPVSHGRRRRFKVARNGRSSPPAVAVVGGPARGRAT